MSPRRGERSGQARMILPPVRFSCACAPAVAAMPATRKKASRWVFMAWSSYAVNPVRTPVKTRPSLHTSAFAAHDYSAAADLTLAVSICRLLQDGQFPADLDEGRDR